MLDAATWLCLKLCLCLMAGWEKATSGFRYRLPHSILKCCQITTLGECPWTVKNQLQYETVHTRRKEGRERSWWMGIKKKNRTLVKCTMPSKRQGTHVGRKWCDLSLANCVKCSCKYTGHVIRFTPWVANIVCGESLLSRESLASQSS